MKFKFENVNSSSKQKEVQKMRDAYEKQAEEDAKKQNTFVERLMGKGIDKKDVIRADAILEDEQRERAAEADEGYEDCLFGKEWRIRILEGLQNSALTVKTISKRDMSDETVYKPRYGGPAIILIHDLQGIIDGKKISIKFKEGQRLKKNIEINKAAISRGKFIKSERVEINEIEGTIDGKPISPQFAKEIYDKYIHSAEERTSSIEKIHTEKNKLKKDKEK